MAPVVFCQAPTQEVLFTHTRSTPKFKGHTLSTASTRSSSAGLQESQASFFFPPHEPMSQATSQHDLVKSGNEPRSSKSPSSSDRQHRAIASGQQPHRCILACFLPFDGGSSCDTVIEQAAEWIVTVKGWCTMHCCGFGVFFVKRLCIPVCCLSGGVIHTDILLRAESCKAPLTPHCDPFRP